MCAYSHAHVHIYISHGHAAPHKQGIDQPQGVHSPHSTRLLRQTRRHLLQRQGVCVRVPAWGAGCLCMCEREIESKRTWHDLHMTFLTRGICLYLACVCESMAQSIKVFEKDDEGNWHPICQSFGFPGTPPLSPPPPALSLCKHWPMMPPHSTYTQNLFDRKPLKFPYWTRTHTRVRMHTRAHSAVIREADWTHPEFGTNARTHTNFLCLCLCLRLRLFLCLRVWLCLCKCVWIYVWSISLNVYVHMYTYTHIRMYVCTCILIHVYVCIYI